METKDLVLLLMIPILLIGMIFYTDSHVAITGFAALQQKGSNIIGAYSITPSFKAKIDYDLSDYNKIKEFLDAIFKCTEANNNIEFCVDKINSNPDNDFEWSLGCDTGAEKVFYDLAGFYQECLGSEDNNCLCKKNFEISAEDLNRHKLLGPMFTISLDKAGLNDLEFKMKYPSSGLSYLIKTSGLAGWTPHTYTVGYDGNGVPIINMIFKDKNDASHSFGPVSDFMLYKNDNNKDKITAIDFVRQDNSKLIYPNKEELAQQSLGECRLRSSIYKFCVSKKNSMITAYDEADGQAKERPITIKFASYITDPPPPPLNGIEVFDRPKSEKSVLAKWEKSKANDAAGYRIYYADSGFKIFENTPAADIIKNKNAAVNDIGLKKIQIIEFEGALAADKCSFDYAQKKCIFSTSLNEESSIENNTLYYFKASDSYVYSLILPEDSKDYDFAVTAIDKNNNEINNVDEKQKFPIVRSRSTDDLPPKSEGIVSLEPLQSSYIQSEKKRNIRILDKPKENIDGTPLKDFKNYKVYFKKYPALPSQEIAKTQSEIQEWQLKDLSALADIGGVSQQSFQIDIASTNPIKDDVYFFVIVAADNLGNPAEDRFKVKELKAPVLSPLII